MSGEGLGDGLPRAVLRLVPQGGTAAAETGTVTATGEVLVTGGAAAAAVGSAVLGCLTVKAAMDGAETPLDIADAFYGTHFGDIHGWAQSCYVPKAPVTAPLPGSESDRDKKTPGRIYVTYTKFNRKTKRFYVGRTSMVIELNKPHYPQALAAIKQRDKNHHVDESAEPGDPAFEPADYDKFDVGTAIHYDNRYRDIAYWRIRGREQQLIDCLGGAQSDTGTPYKTENMVRGVARDNPLGRQFDAAATEYFKKLIDCSGYHAKASH